MRLPPGPDIAEEHRIVSQNIRKARAAAGKTRLEVAYKAGVDPVTVANAERGGPGGMDSKLKIAKALGLKPEQMFKRG